MSTEPPDLADQIDKWATGYGDRRHLIREGTRKSRWSREEAVALCRATISVDSFGDRTGKPFGGQTEQDIVASRKPCSACLRKAGATPS